jgi:hypothetical protein
MILALGQRAIRGRVARKPETIVPNYLKLFMGHHTSALFNQMGKSLNRLECYGEAIKF